MKALSLRKGKAIYVVCCLPFLLALLSWSYFPPVAQWVIAHAFSYRAVQPSALLWNSVMRFFYSWYTLLAIGFAGFWAVVAKLANTRLREEVKHSLPMVSFIVPAFNEERNVPQCLESLFKCASIYNGLCEIIVIDDGSRDFTYEIAWSTIELNRRLHPMVKGRVVRHSTNLGKIEAIKTGTSKAQGGIIAVVDADSQWTPDTLVNLVAYMISNGKKAVTGYVHPSDGKREENSYVILQQLEYSQGLGISRRAQSLGNNVLVISGAIGLYDAHLLRQILGEREIRSITEDLEITLEMQKRGAKVGYVSTGRSITMAPTTLRVLWSQRLRWFTGWLHNTLDIHRGMLLKKSWTTLLLWYCYIFEYFGAIIDLAAIVAFPFLLWFAPDRVLFLLSLILFIPYGFLIGVINQAMALKFSYGKHNYSSLLFYTPLYPVLRLVNVMARLTSLAKYSLGNHGKWQTTVVR